MFISPLPDHIDPRHCIVTKQYAVYTPPMHEFIGQLGDWIDQQTPGGYVYGASRLGKSRCIQWYVTKVLAERFKSDLPVIVWSRPPDSHTSEADFWHQLLLASHFAFANPAGRQRRFAAMQACKQRFIAIANAVEKNYVILLIDEAQDLTLREWKWLVGLQNELDYAGYLLSVFSVGSHQLNYRHEYMGITGNAHVAGRFMTAHTRFYGLRAIEEIEYVLNGYDVDSEWPPDSQLSYLQYFAPDYFLSGRRLTQSTDNLWRALIASCPNAKRPHLEFPMQHVARATEAILFRLATGADWSVVTSYESWMHELSKTSLSDHLRLIALGS